MDLCCTVLQIAKALGSNWFEIGICLTAYEKLKEYERRYQHNSGSYRCLLDVLVDWTKKEDHPVIGKLVDACKEAEVGGKVKRLLNYKDV